MVIRGHDKRIECLLLTLASCVSSISLHSEKGVRGVDPLVGTNGKEKSINRLPNRTMETHTLKFDSRRPALAGQHFLPPTGQKSWWGDCHRTSINHDIGLSSIYTITLGEGKWTRWKTRILLWHLMMGCPACAAGRPGGRLAGIFLVFPIHPPVSWIHMDSEETCIWPFSYITGRDGVWWSRGEGEVVFFRLSIA